MQNSLPTPEAKRAKILVVSDTRVNRIVVSRILEGMGMVSQTVSSREALATSDDFRLIVIDDGPDGGDSAGLVRHFRNRKQMNGIPAPRIVFLSTDAGLPDDVDPDSVDQVVPKPLNSERLEAAILRHAR